jgi:phage repressor protein C with HTH and peptisase S24 domain
MRAMSESSITENYRIFPTFQEDNSYSRLTAGNSYSRVMDRARELILEWAEKSGNSLAKLSKAVGKSHSYFSEFIRKGSPINLPEDVRIAAASVMNVEDSRLRGTPVRRGGKPQLTQNARIGGPVPITSTIPAYGQASGGRDGQFVLNGNKVADIVAPPSLSGVPDAYAVYVVGTSMEPRYLAGEVVFVNPRLPVRQDDFVVAQIAAEVEGDPPLAYVKRFVSMDDKQLRLAQFNPKKTLTFPRALVVSVHRIVMGGDG